MEGAGESQIKSLVASSPSLLRPTDVSSTQLILVPHWGPWASKCPLLSVFPERILILQLVSSRYVIVIFALDNDTKYLPFARREATCKAGFLDLSLSS